MLMEIVNVHTYSKYIKILFASIFPITRALLSQSGRFIFMLQLYHEVKFKAPSVSPDSGVTCTEMDSQTSLLNLGR